jgi:hypothetical protein
MNTIRRTTTRVAFVSVLMVLTPALMSAHDVLYPGTVLTVEAERVQVKTVDPDTKKEATLWFTVTRDTKVKRGEKTVTYVNARITKDERLVVVVNHDADVKNVATEIRLAAR